MLRKLIKYLKKHTSYGRSRYLNFLYKYDMNRFLRYSAMNSENKKHSVETEIQLLVHSIEKALSLPDVRVGFGTQKVKDLITKINEYKNLASAIEYRKIYDIVLDAIYKYIEFQKGSGCNLDLSFIPNEMILSQSIDKVGIEYSSVNDFSMLSFFDFAKSRHSLRYFGNTPVKHEQIYKAMEIARTSPSACNRQSIKAYACMNKEKIDSIISIHGGMRGFGEPSAIIALTGDLGSYTCEYERNTVYVDGGIFLMNLLYAFHYLNLATCPLIWGMEPDNDKKLFELMNLPHSKTIISLIAVGNYPIDTYKYAKSLRRDIDEILEFCE